MKILYLTKKNKIARKEFNKISNPILDFKYFIKFFDVYCLIIISISLFISFYESDNDINFGVIRIYNSILQLIILIIYIIRYTKFIKVKQFLFDNEDIYKNDSYFPNKIINFDKRSSCNFDKYIYNQYIICCFS